MKTHVFCPICHSLDIKICISHENEIIRSRFGKERGVPLDLRGFSRIISALYFCPHCHYIFLPLKMNHDRSKFLAIAETDNFKAWINNKEIPEPARIFMGFCIISWEKETYRYAGASALNAAWICDNNRLYTFSRICRETAAESFFKCSERSDTEFSHCQVIQMIDCYRRAGNFMPAMDRALYFIEKKIEIIAACRIAIKVAEDK